MISLASPGQKCFDGRADNLFRDDGSTESNRGRVPDRLVLVAGGFSEILFVILKLDYRGEGGIFALSALIRGAIKKNGRPIHVASLCSGWQAQR